MVSRRAISLLAGFSLVLLMLTTAIDKRLSIYFDTKTCTLAAVNYFKRSMKVIEVYGLSGVEDTSKNMMKILAYS